MDMVHQVDNEDKDVYECGILSQSTCAVTDHQTHLLLKVMKTLSGPRLTDYRRQRAQNVDTI